MPENFVLKKKDVIHAVTAAVNDPKLAGEIKKEVKEAVDAYRAGNWQQYASFIESMFALHEDSVDTAVATPEGGPASSFVSSWREQHKVQLATYSAIMTLTGA